MTFVTPAIDSQPVRTGDFHVVLHALSRECSHFVMVRKEVERLRPRKVDQQTRSVETRQRILDAAKAEFAERGYDGCTTNHIAQHAGMSIGSLYQYYPNKDAILAALMLEHIDHGVEAIATALAQCDARDEPFEQTLFESVRAYVAIHSTDRKLHDVLFDVGPRLPVVRDRMREVGEAIVVGATERLRAARPALAEPEVVAEAATVMLEALVHRFVASDRPLDVDTLARYLTDVILDSVDRAGERAHQ